MWGKSRTLSEAPPLPHAQLPAPVSVRGPVLLYPVPPAQRRCVPYLGCAGEAKEMEAGPPPSISPIKIMTPELVSPRFFKALLFLTESF